MLAVLITLFLIMGTVACTGTGKQDKQEDAVKENTETSLNEPGEYPIVRDPVEMRMFLSSSPLIEDFATNDFTAYMEKLTGIKWKFEVAPEDSLDEKMNLTLQSGDYPDVFWRCTPDFAKYGSKEGIIIPLDDLINEENMPNYMHLVTKYPQYLDMTREADGKIYSLCSVNECFHCTYARKMWVNTELMDKIGAEMPGTTDEFYEVCKKYLDYDPEGIVLTGCDYTGWHGSVYKWIMGSFLLVSDGKVDEVLSPEGKVVSAAVDDRYKEALKYLKSLYDLVAIDEAAFSQKADDMKSLINREPSNVLFFPQGASVSVIDPTANKPLFDQYIVLEPLQGPEGISVTPNYKYSGGQSGMFFITDKCKNPEAALRWADWFYGLSENDRLNLPGIMSCFGFNDGEYELNPEGWLGLNGKPAVVRVAEDFVWSSDPQNHDWQDNVLTANLADCRNSEAMFKEEDYEGLKLHDNSEKLLYDETAGKQVPHGQDPEKDGDILPELKLTADESSQIGTMVVEVQKLIEENTAMFITGQKDIESEWDNYKKDLDKAGLQTVLEVYNTAYQRQK